MPEGHEYLNTTHVLVVYHVRDGEQEYHLRTIMNTNVFKAASYAELIEDFFGFAEHDGGILSDAYWIPNERIAEVQRVYPININEKNMLNRLGLNAEDNTKIAHENGQDCICEVPRPRHAGVHPTTCQFCKLVIDAENWGGDPEGPLAKALEKARKESKKSKKPLKIEKLDAESFEAEDKKKPTTNLRAIRRRRKLKALGFKDAEDYTECDLCNNKSDDDPYSFFTTVMNPSSGDMEVLCTDCYDNKMCMACRSCDTTTWGKALVFDPTDDNYKKSPLCRECYDALPEKDQWDAESEQKETPQEWVQRKMKPYRMNKMEHRAESGPIVIDGYMPKRVEVFSDTVLFYIGDMAEMRYGHPEVQRKLLGDISIIDPNGIRKEDVEKILKREWDGRFFLFEDGGTFVGNERTYESEQFEAVYCSKCKRWGYSDQMTKDNSGGYLCTRCSRPDIDWVAHDKKYGASKGHRYYKPPLKGNEDSITTRFLKKKNQKRGQRDGETFSWLVIGLGVVFILGANKIVVSK